MGEFTIRIEMEELDQKVQEAVSKAMEGLDERVARAVEKAVEKLAPKQGVTSEEARKQPLAATGPSGGK